MPLDFPLGATVGQTYLNWTFDGSRWVITPDPRAPFVSRAGDQMAGALEVILGTPPSDDDATPKKYVDDAIASGALYQGTWVALTNVPDLSGTAHQNGWAWVVITSDPHVNEATGVAIPGLPAGTMVGNGDRIVWDAGTSQFELIHSPGMTQAEADARYLRLIGGTLSGPGSLTVAGNFAAEAGTALAALAGSVVVGTNTNNPTASLSVQQDVTVGRNVSLVADGLSLPLNIVRSFYSISASPFTSLQAFIQDRPYSFRATLVGTMTAAWPDMPVAVGTGVVFLDVQKHNTTPTSHSRFVKLEIALRKFWNYMQAAGTWAGWQEIAIYGALQPQPWYFYRAGGYSWIAPLNGYYNLIAAGPGGGGCNWVGSSGSAARYWCGGSGGVAGRRLYLQTGDILYITVPRGGYPAGGTGAQGAANFGPITDVGGGYQSTVINSPNYDSPGMPPGWLGNRSLWIVAQFGLSGWNTTPAPAYSEPGDGITVFPGNGPSATGNTPGQPRGMSLGYGTTRGITAQSGRGGSYMEGGGDGMAAISYDGPT